MSLRCWRSVAEGTMGSNLVVFPSPAFNQNLRLQQSVKDSRFSNSSLSFPLKLSIYPFSQGLPGSM